MSELIVKAKELGHYKTRRREGVVFQIEKPEHFSHTWMEAVDWTPPVQTKPKVLSTMDLLKRIKELEASTVDPAVVTGLEAQVAELKAAGAEVVEKLRASEAQVAALTAQLAAPATAPAAPPTEPPAPPAAPPAGNQPPV